jgi:FdhE protein
VKVTETPRASAVAAGFIRKLLGQPTASSPEVGEALAELARLAEGRPTLAGPAALLRDILPGLFAEPGEEASVAVTSEGASAKLAGGVPLLHGESLSADGKAFRRRWLHVCTAVDQHQRSDAARALAACLRRDRVSPDELVQAVLAGRAELVHARADELGLDAGLTATVLRLTLFPVLARLNMSLAPLRDDCAWEQGYCPTCGSWPLLGEFRGLEQTRWLRCGLCASDWEFPRLKCPFCGARDHRVLGYLHVQGEEAKHRAATCDECRGYVKMATTLAALSAPQLLVADVATMHLDLAAAERGYALPA